MPGIVGMIGKAARRMNSGELGMMVKSLMHEPFYHSGTYTNQKLDLCVGWAMHQGSFSDCMPVWNEQRNICLVLTGETYADQAEIDALRTAGHEFEPGKATYLVHLYEERGIKVLEELNGWFGGILVDLRQQRVVLFNDRYGLSRIYYSEDEEGLWFSSEAKSLLHVLPPTRCFDLQSLGEFLSCGCVLQNRTLFRGIRLMPGASAWTFAAGQQVRKETYFRKETWENQAPLTGQEYYERLRAMWPRILPRYFAGKERVALSLTGGIDSRMILGFAPVPAGALPCYTFGGRYRDCQDVKLARDVARICQQPHEVISVDGEFLSEFPALAERTVYLSDGAMDVTGSIDLYVQKKARQIASVRLSGVYGGEILRSVVVFSPMTDRPEYLDPELALHFRAPATTYAEERQGHKLSFIAFKQAAWFMTSKFSIERSQVTFRTPYFDNDLVALAYRAPAEVMNYGPMLRLIAERNSVLGGIGTDRGRMLQSIPVISAARHAYQEFTFKAEYAYDYGMPQWLASVDHALAPLRLERLFLGRHKFHHFRVYYRDELSQYVKAILLDPRTLSRPYLNRAAVEKMVKSHTNGRRNYTSEIHKLLSSELIERQLLERN